MTARSPTSHVQALTAAANGERSRLCDAYLARGLAGPSGAPALRGNAAGASQGWRNDMPVQVPALVVEGPVQEVLLPWSVEQHSALPEFAQVRAEPM